MKNILLVLTALLLLVSCNQTPKTNAEAPKKVLVLYYSQTGATKSLAEEIQKQMNADIEEIFAVNPYNGDFNATIARCQEEMANGTLPQIELIKSVIDNYDVVFLGYPIWFGKAAPPILSFVNSYDLSKVKVIPFCTFGSGGKSSGVKSLEENSCSKLNLGPCYGIRNARIEAAKAEVAQFLCENEILKGDFEKKADYSAQEPVTDEEKKIFEQACGDYPMLHATPVTVGQRKVNAGTEYLFVAEDKGADGAVANVKVYVGVYDENNLNPVFTEVER